MNIAIIGAGLVGVATAFELSSDGHEVTVYERLASIAAEGSFACGGSWGAGYASSWLTPGLAWNTLSLNPWRTGSSGAGLLPALAALPWAWQHGRALHRRHPAGAQGLLELAIYSQRRLTELAQSQGLTFEQSQGLMVLFQTSSDAQRAQRWMDLLQQNGLPVDRLSADEVRQRSPGLNPMSKLLGAAFLRTEGLGNIRLLAQTLRTRAEARGARFMLDHDVNHISPGAPVEVSVLHSGASFKARHDAVVLCAGAHSANLARSLGVRLPVLKLWGQSITAPLSTREGWPHDAPRHSLFDLRHRLTLTRLGTRLRVAAGSQWGGQHPPDGHFSPKALYQALDRWLPGAADLGKVQHWSGNCAMWAGGLPRVGPLGSPGVWLNAGHGQSGFALASGCARMLADLMAGRRPEVGSLILNEAPSIRHAVLAQRRDPPTLEP